MKADLDMWLTCLQEPQVYSREFIEFRHVLDVEDIDMYSDSSRNFDLGCGGICRSDYFWMQWDDYVKEVQPSIEYLELYAVMVAVLLWIHKFKNRRIYLFCDNQSAVYMINSMSSTCKNCMVLIRILVLEGLRQNIKIFAKHVKSEANDFSDSLSRLQFNRFRSLVLQHNRKFNNEPTSIPECIWPISKIWKL